MDIQIGQVFTPVIAMDKHYTVVDSVANKDCMVYARAFSQWNIVYVTTKAMIVTTLTSSREVAEYAARN